jgi:arsenate reductase (glutaredoxin)
MLYNKHIGDEGEEAMPQTVVYGIKNCDTMKKTFLWLDNHRVDYVFHDYKKSGGDKAVLQRVFQQHGWEDVLNRKGTTWRKLPEDARNSMTATKALKIAQENPSIIKRPLIIQGDDILLGFDESVFKKRFL